MCYGVMHYLLLEKSCIAYAIDFICLLVDICSSLQIISYSPKSRINNFKQMDKQIWIYNKKIQ